MRCWLLIVCLPVMLTVCAPSALAKSAQVAFLSSATYQESGSSQSDPELNGAGDLPKSSGQASNQPNSGQDAKTGDATTEAGSGDSNANAASGSSPQQPGSEEDDTNAADVEVSGDEDDSGQSDTDSTTDAATVTGDGSSTANSGVAVNQPAVTGPAPQTTTTWLNRPTHILHGVVLVALAIASIVARYLKQKPADALSPALVRRFRQRLVAWWLMCAILIFGLYLRSYGTVLLFFLVSFWALREFITMAPTRRGDHRALFWALIVFTPLQYLMIGMERIGFNWWNGKTIDFYGLYSIFIPVYASLFIPARIAISGDHKRFLERSAQITAGLLICVYALSYAPALINLELTHSNGSPWTGSQAGLLFYLVLVTQLADILQWTWGQLVGKRIIAPEISSSRTWEGFAGGTLSTGLIGGSLFWVTPFTFWEAMGISVVIAIMGMFGGMTMSAIKRDRGVNDYGTLVLGHAGVLDRIDTLCFAAPVFYHLTRFFYT